MKTETQAVVVNPDDLATARQEQIYAQAENSQEYPVEVDQSLVAKQAAENVNKAFSLGKIRALIAFARQGINAVDKQQSQNLGIGGGVNTAKKKG